MTPQSDTEDTDLKPFLDMLVGIVFITLILVAAQMFFTQWGQTVETAERERRQQIALQREREIAAFLEHAASELRSRGIFVAVDYESRTLSLPLDRIVSVAHEAGDPRVDPDAAMAIGRALVSALGCLQGGGGERPACPGLDLLRLGDLRFETRIAAVPAGVPLPPDRYARLAGELVHTGILAQSPGLLGFTGAAGGAALQAPSSRIGAQGSSAPALLSGELTAAFRFDAAPTSIGP